MVVQGKVLVLGRKLRLRKISLLLPLFLSWWQKRKISLVRPEQCSKASTTTMKMIQKRMSIIKRYPHLNLGLRQTFQPKSYLVASIISQAYLLKKPKSKMLMLTMQNSKQMMTGEKKQNRKQTQIMKIYSRKTLPKRNKPVLKIVTTWTTLMTISYDKMKLGHPIYLLQLRSDDCGLYEYPCHNR